MAYYPPETIARVKEIDLLTYLQNQNPSELKYEGRNTYHTVTHDSLKISNGMWNWFSRGIGGKTALEYLIKVEEKSFQEAMATLTNRSYEVINSNKKIERKPTKFKMPVFNDNEDKAISYLISRGIDESIINECISKELIYQEKNTDNVLFVGLDNNNEIKYISARGTRGARYLSEASGSDKAYSFKLLSDSNSNEVHIFESAIDVLSFATLLKMYGKEWYKYNLLSLAGIYKPAKEISESKVPLALETFLNNNKNITKIVLHLDNDLAGRLSTNAIMNKLKDKYEVVDLPCKKGKDVNDFLLYLKNKSKEQSR